MRALLAALLFAGYCACFASWVLAAEDRSTSEIRARQMLERAWAEIDTTTTIEFNDSLALRVGPAPRGASPDSLRALAALLTVPANPGFIPEPDLEGLPSLISIVAPTDSAGTLPSRRRVFVRVLISPLGFIERAQVRGGPRERWSAALRSAMRARFRPGQRAGITLSAWVEIPL